MSIASRSTAVGARITISGGRCQATPNHRTTHVGAFVSRAGSHGFYGTLAVGTVDPRRFEFQYVIPRWAHDWQGEGGGLIRPGDRITFSTSPEVCSATVIVAAS